MYFLVIGAQKNTVQILRKKRGEDLLQEVKIPNLLSDKQQTKVVIQISRGKYIIYILVYQIILFIENFRDHHFLNILFLHVQMD